jgi:hypothetical protein
MQKSDWKTNRKERTSGSSLASLTFGILGLFSVAIAWPIAVILIAIGFLCAPKHQRVHYCCYCGNDVSPRSLRCPHCGADEDTIPL